MRSLLNFILVSLTAAPSLTHRATRTQGLETTRYLATSGARVLIASRTPAKVHTAIQELITSDPSLEGRLQFVQLDLSSLKQVKECARVVLQGEQRLDGVVNNAGVMAAPYELTEVRSCGGVFAGGRGDG